MSFDASDLSVLAYANNFTLWHYTSPDDAVTITGAGYLNAAVDMLRKNDLIITNVDTDGTPVTNFYIVTSNDGSSVGITLFSA